MDESVEFIDEPCRNCGDTTPGRFCRSCGQRKGEVRVSMRRLVGDVLEDQLSINAALPRTLKALFLHPGQLTIEYARGRIASYIAPFRLYLVASLLFFLTLSVASRAGLARVTTEASTPASIGTAAEPAGTEPRAPGRRVSGPGIQRNEIESDTVDWTNAIRTHIPAVDAMIQDRVERLEGMPARQVIREVATGFLQYAPTAMFILLPVFALVLQIMYVGSRRFYVEHFVFALHYHAFAFLLFTVIILLPESFVPSLLLIWLVLYMPLALRRVYGQGWFITVVKWSVISTIYSILIGFGVFATAVVAFLAG